MISHLHLHTESSIGDAILKLDEALAAVRADGQAAMAVTDHGTLGNHWRALALAPKYSVNVLLGVEAYFDAGLPPHADGYPRLCHLILIAKDLDGYRNLVRLQRQAWTRHLVIGRFPALTMDAIEKFGEGLICTTACVGGPVGRAIGVGQWDTAEDLFMRFNDIFGEDFYGEGSAHPLAEQPEVNRAVAMFAKRAGRRIVQTTDAHYLGQNDWIAHDCFMKTRDKRRSAYRYPAACFHLATERRIRSYGLPAEWADETNAAAEKCTAAGELRSAALAAATAVGDVVEEVFLSRSIPVTPQDASRSAGVWAGLSCGVKRSALRSVAKKIESLPRAVVPDFRYALRVPAQLKDLIPVRSIDGLTVAEMDLATARQFRLAVRQTSEGERRPHRAAEDFYKGLTHWYNDRPQSAVRLFGASIAGGGPIQARIKIAQALIELGRRDESEKWLRELRQDPLVESLHLKKSVLVIGRRPAPSDEFELQLYPEVARLTLKAPFRADLAALQKICEPVFSNGLRDLILSFDGRESRLKSVLPRFRRYLKYRGVRLHVNVDLA